MEILLLLLAAVALIAGFMSLSQATLGVGILAVACFFGILARLAQANRHHKEIQEGILTSLEQAERHQKEIIDKIRLSSSGSISRTEETQTDSTNPKGVSPKNPSVQLCPTCKIPMVVKAATQGPLQGTNFYVCPNHKQCKQSFPVE